MAKNFRSTEMAAAGLRKELKAISGMMLVGGGLTAAGLAIFAGLEKTLKPATEYQHQLNILNMAGLKHVEVAEAIGAAWQNTGTVITTTATENLRAILDLRNVLGSMNDAKWALPIVTKVGAVMASSSESSVKNNAQDIAFSMAKALDIIGAAKDPRSFEREAGLMSKVVTAFQNRVSPKQYQSVFQYARQAKFDLSDEFKYEFLPSLMLEMSSGTKSAGGGSRGVGPMLAAIYRVTNQGYVSKKALPVLDKLGLLASHDYAATSTTGTVGAQLVGKDLAAQNPFLWSQQVLVPAIRTMLGKDATDQNIRSVINQVFAGNQLAASAMTEFFTKPQNYLRDQKIIQGAMPYGAAYDEAVKNDPELQLVALKAQWHNFITGIGIQVLPDFMAIVKSLVPMVHDLAMWTQKNPDGVRNWIRGFELLGAVLVASGGVTLIAGVARSLKLLFGVFGLAKNLPTIVTSLQGVSSAVGSLGLLPLIGIAAGITAVVAALYLTWKYKDQMAKAETGTVPSAIPGKPSQRWMWTPEGPIALGADGQPAGNKASPFVPKKKNMSFHVESPVYLDGKLIARHTVHHVADMLGGPQTGTSGYDPYASLAPVGSGVA